MAKTITLDKKQELLVVEAIQKSKENYGELITDDEFRSNYPSLTLEAEDRYNTLADIEKTLSN